MEVKKAIERVTIILSEYKQNQQYLCEDYTMVPEEDLNRWKQENEEGIEALEEALRTMKEHKEAQTITGINQVAREIHENAVEHGWWDEERGFPEVIALIHSEVSEALEEYRNHREPTEIYIGDKGKPEGIPYELADVIIRILDYCGYAGIDIDAAITEKHEYNKTRPYRHGGKVC